MHQIDPARLDLAREFKARPLGPHSPDLQKVLKILRWNPVEGRVVALQPERDGSWYLARLTGPKGHPIEVFRQRAYATLLEAYWALFRRGWEDHTGQVVWKRLMVGGGHHQTDATDPKRAWRNTLLDRLWRSPRIQPRLSTLNATTPQTPLM